MAPSIPPRSLPTVSCMSRPISISMRSGKSEATMMSKRELNRKGAKHAKERGSRRKHFFLCALCAFAVQFLMSARADAPQPLYANDFEKADEGSLPKEMVVLGGNFAVKTIDGNKLLELPGDPLESFG